MRRVIFVFAISVVILSVVFLSKQANSFDTYVAHPHLTEAAINIYNKNFGNKISNVEKQKIIQGSIEEDTPIRWMNHFYNPNTNKGLAGYATAKKWAQNSASQGRYAIGDQSWSTALNAYANRDYDTAFVALGHVLHLMEDMAVPAHTRLDSHPGGDPLESWVENNNPYFSAGRIQYYDNLNSYFDNLAEFSNNYFYSKDTIKADELSKLLVLNRKGVDGLYVDCVVNDSVGDYCVAVAKEDNFGNIEYKIDDTVNSDYYSILAPKAVSYAAGVIQLFFEQGEALRDERDAAKAAAKAKYDAYIGELTKLFVYQNGKLVSAADLLKNSETSKKVADVIIQSTNVNKAKVTKEIINILSSSSTPVTIATTTVAEKVMGVKISSSTEPIDSASSTPKDTASTSTKKLDDEKTDQSFSGTPAEAVEPWPVLILDPIFSYALYASSTPVTIFGECASGTQSIFVWRAADATSTSEYAADTVVMASGTIWSAEIIPEYGNNFYYFNALGDIGRATSTLSAAAQIVLDNLAPASTSLAVEIIATSTTSTLIYLNFSAEENFSVPIAYDLDFAVDGGEWEYLLASSAEASYDFTATSSGEYDFRLRASDSLGNVGEYVYASTTVGIGPVEYEYTHLSGEQVEDELVLTATGSPYILEEYTVPAGKILRLEPGTVIKGLNYQSVIFVYGSMYAEGTADAHITFTSVQDRSFNTERLNAYDYGTAEAPNFWDWSAIWFLEGSSSELNYSDIIYAGYDRYLLSMSMIKPCYSWSIAANRADLSINNSTITKGGNSMIYANSSNLSVSNTTIDYQWDGGAYGKGITALNGTLSLDNVIFANLQNGVYSYSTITAPSVITINNFSSLNFTNVDIPIYPEDMIILQ